MLKKLVSVGAGLAMLAGGVASAATYYEGPGRIEIHDSPTHIEPAAPDRDGAGERPPRRDYALAGAGALALGALIAAPWYIRTWMRTGSPVFPFYLSIWPAEAPGWDVARSRLYQSLLSMYGDPHSALDYVLAPIRLAVSAQPDQPAHYDGVLGIAFLFALPLLAWALYGRRLDAELRIAVLVSTAMLLFWLFSSQQLRFLLPALPGFAVAIAAAGMAAEDAGLGRPSARPRSAFPSSWRGSPSSIPSGRSSAGSRRPPISRGGSITTPTTS